MIPAHAVLPSLAKGDVPHMPMPRRSPYLDMTDIYNLPGHADECGALLENNPEAHALFEAQIAYRRGEIDKVYDRARYFLASHSGFYAILGGGMLLAQVAIWRGDVELWNEAKRHICEAPCKNPVERDIVSLSLAIVDSSVYDNRDFPEWFTSGSFGVLPPDAHPAAKVFYVKHLYMSAFAIASKQMELEGVQGLALMRLIPYTIEPMITQAAVDKTVVPEIYLRLSCAVAYHNSGQMDKAVIAMKDISKASEEIKTIVIALDDITSETSLLALNASIEAARAGEAGKGFAVVAENVSKLAEASSKSTDTIGKLVENALECVLRGTQIVDDAAASLNGIIDNTNTVNEIISKLNDQSKLEHELMEEINNLSVSILDVVTDNSAISEECAASSADLITYSGNLKNSVAKFETN